MMQPFQSLGSLLYTISCTSSGTLSISRLLSSPYSGWFPVVLAAAVLILGILGMVFALSGAIGRNDLKTWVRIKMFDTVFSILLIVVFASIGTLACSVNPVNALSKVNLVENYGNIASSGLFSNPNQFNCQSTSTTLYDVSLCDLSAFNYAVTNLNNGIFYFGMAFSSIPLLTVDLNLSESGIGAGLWGFSPLPSTPEQWTGTAASATYALLMLNQVQLLLLAAALPIFAIFMSIGLIARVFGVTRSFGGAMIAFAIGLGIIYPLMVTVTYGFLDYSLNTTVGNFNTLLTLLSNAKIFGGLVGAVFVLGGTLTNSFLTSLLNLLCGVNSAFCTPSFLNSVVLYVAVLLIGLTFIPFLNFMIVDAFIVDFSQAIGERMDFLSLLGSVI